MEKQVFKKTIQAPAEKVWTALWNEDNYREWTAAFAEGSDVKTDWQEGSKVYFIDGKGSGMVSMIAEKRDNEFMSFKHLGTVRDGVEDLNNPKDKGWVGALENYTLHNKNGQTEVVVDMDVSEDHKDYFLKTWPVALEKLREIAERNS